MLKISIYLKWIWFVNRVHPIQAEVEAEVNEYDDLAREDSPFADWMEEEQEQQQEDA